MPLIEIREDTYIEMFWIVGWGLGDWMGVAFRDTPEAPWQGRHRLRIYTSAKVWDDTDHKAFYALEGPKTLEEIGAALDEIAAKMSREVRRDFPGRSVKVLRQVVQGGGQAFLKAFEKTGFMHKLVVPQAEGPARPQ